MTIRSSLCAVMLLLSSLCAGQEPTALAGKLVITGSDTLGALSALWAQGLMRMHPGVTVQVRAIGSSAAPTALVEGISDIGPMSRPMTDAEEAYFIDRFGYAPTAIPVAVDALSVFVHRENPLRSLTVSTVDSLFSANRRCGGESAVGRWAELGLTGPWEERYVTLYGRDAASGTYGFFRQQLMCGGDFKASVNRLVGSAAVVRAVSRDRSAIGYASAGFLTDSVRALRILDGQAREKRLSRDLLLYVNQPPGKPPQPLVSAYLQQALGAEGQAMVRSAGYSPLSAARRRPMLDALLRETR